MIDCKYWKECGVKGGGCCKAGLYGGQPSYGVCMSCSNRTPAGEEEPIGFKKMNIVAKAVSYATAEISAMISKIPDEEFEFRMSQCRACSNLDPLPEPQVGFCKSCGCGRSVRAELTVKGKMPKATCPLNKWAKPADTSG
jgi:hypothetical protein